MKTIMLLGGSRFLLPVIESSRKSGYYIITCDNLPGNIAHSYSDEYCNASIIEKENILKIAKEKKIDGIMSFACDPGVVTAAYVAENLGLPSCGPYESVEILQNKRRFREFLKDNGFNVPIAKGYKTKEEVFYDLNGFCWPVIVKPVDSAGSKGVTRADTPDELKKSIQYAFLFSKCHEVIIEEFLEAEGFSSDADSFSLNGKLNVVSFSSQRFDKASANPYTPSAYSWPTTISSVHQKELIKDIQRVLDLLKMGTSIYNIEVRECINGKSYIMEISPRGGGNRLAEILRLTKGIDLITNSVRAAVGDPLISIEEHACDGAWAEIILHSNKSGIFDSIWISEEISNNIIEKDFWVHKGEKVDNFTGANKAIGTLVLRVKTQKRLQEILEEQDKYIKIILKEDLME